MGIIRGVYFKVFTLKNSSLSWRLHGRISHPVPAASESIPCPEFLCNNSAKYDLICSRRSHLNNSSPVPHFFKIMTSKLLGAGEKRYNRAHNGLRCTSILPGIFDGKIALDDNNIRPCLLWDCDEHIRQEQRECKNLHEILKKIPCVHVRSLYLLSQIFKKNRNRITCKKKCEGCDSNAWTSAGMDLKSIGVGRAFLPSHNCMIRLRSDHHIRTIIARHNDLNALNY